MLIRKTSTDIFNNLLFGKRVLAGRNNAGRITVRYKGGTSVSRVYRIIDFKRYIWNIQALVLSTEYDPNRSALINLASYTNSIFAYLLAPLYLSISNVVGSFNKVSHLKSEDRLGYCAYLKFIKPGLYIHGLELRPSGGVKYVRAALNYAKLVSNSEFFSIVKLRSKTLLKVSNLCVAAVGTLASKNTYLKLRKGAGFNRRLGRRPHVRGVAMNPVDHPHGGGQGKTSGGRPSVSPWAVLSKGKKTRRKINYGTFIMKR